MMGCNHMLKLRKLTEDNSDSVSPPGTMKTPLINMPVDEVVSGMSSPDEKIVLQATQTCRKMLSCETNPPIDVIISNGIVQRCVEFLGYHHNPSLQFEATWALTNVASGTTEETQVLIDHGSIPNLIKLLESPYANVSEQAVWALGNIAGNGEAARDQILALNAMPLLINLINPNITIPYTQNIVRTISNLCRDQCFASLYDRVKIALPVLKDLLTNTDKNILAEACWALSYLTDGFYEEIQAALDCGVVPYLVALLASSEVGVLIPALRSVGNIATGNAIQVDTVISAGAARYLCGFLQHQNPNIVKEAAKIIKSITAGNLKHIQHVIDAEILPPLINVLQSGDCETQNEAAWAITNIACYGTTSHIAILVQIEVITPFFILLDAKYWDSVDVILDGLMNILAVAEPMGKLERFAIMIEEIGGLEKLRSFQYHEKQVEYRMAMEIIEFLY